MQSDKSPPAIDKPPPGDKDEKTNQARTQSDTEPFDGESESLPELRQAADDLKKDRRGETPCRRWTRRLEIPTGNDASPTAASTFATKRTNSLLLVIPA
jgi:hypothetical protein